MSGATCATCGAVTEPAAMIYAKTGDLVCPACHEREQEKDASERVTGARTVLIVGSAASLSAVAAFAAWAYAYHDRTFVYAKGGGDASGEVLKRGFGLSLFVAMAVGALVNWLLGRARARQTTPGGRA